MESYPKNNNNTNVVSALKEIYSSSGKNKQAWEDLLVSIYQSSSYKEILSFFIQIIRNEPSNIMTLDIIDFLIDYGPKNLVREISSIDFMNNIVNLMKMSSGSGLEVQKKGIYLTKKWNEKANAFPNEEYEGFTHNYKELSLRGICFPPSGYKLFTYELYISEMDANILKAKAEQSLNNNDFNNLENENNKGNPFKNDELNLDMDDDVPITQNSNRDVFFSRIEPNKKDSLNYNNNIINEKKINNIGFPKIEDDEKKEEEEFSTPNPFNAKNKDVKFPSSLDNDFSDIQGSEINVKLRSKIMNSKINDNDEDKDTNISSKMTYPSYDDRQKENKNKINDYGQNSGGTPTGDDFMNNNSNKRNPFDNDNRNKSFNINSIEDKKDFGF